MSPLPVVVEVTAAAVTSAIHVPQTARMFRIGGRLREFKAFEAADLSLPGHRGWATPPRRHSRPRCTDAGRPRRDRMESAVEGARRT